MKFEKALERLEHAYHQGIRSEDLQHLTKCAYCQRAIALARRERETLDAEPVAKVRRRFGFFQVLQHIAPGPQLHHAAALDPPADPVDAPALLAFQVFGFRVQLVAKMGKQRL